MRVHMKVRGRVQGVGYRYFVARTAKSHSLTGWVKNCPDGDVEGEVQGDPKEIEDFLKRLETGHGWARIDHVRSEKIAEKKNEGDFDIVI